MTSTKPALETAIEALLREKGPLHRTDIEFYIFEACAHEQPGWEAFARELLRGGVGTNVCIALSDLRDSGRVLGPTSEGFSVPATSEKAKVVPASAVEVERLRRVEKYAREVMDTLERYGEGIVKHLLDNDDNSGERLRRALSGIPDGT